MTETQTIKITKGEYDNEYVVLIDGEVAGSVSRNDDIPNGYWGRWKAGRNHFFDSRRAAVNFIVNRYNDR